MNIQLHKKVLKHIQDLLNEIDSYPTYKEISNCLDDASISPEIKGKILKTFNINMSKEFSKIRDCKEWIEALSSDIRNQS